MGLRINTNMASLIGTRNVSRTDRALNKSLERLSSGLRINRAADDPAGLAIAERQRAQIAGLNKALENVERGVSLVQTAEGALDEVNSLLVHMRELAVDSANSAVHDADSLAANQAEITDAIATLNRISTNTTFGTKALLDGTATGLIFQVGGDASQTATLDLPAVDATTLALNAIDVTTDVGAQAAITAIDAAIGTIVTARNSIGSFQANTLESQMNYLQLAAENMTAARSVVMDTDFAAEVTAFTKQQILMQAGMQVLSTAGQLPQMVLNLLR